ncbi:MULTISPECIES: murein hydrolase activator EnvC family protein [Lachnospiraceae]|uniref:murein hydrolase activator EnvC family protein n=1 Tax=Lachnospiraceae TaxID=186803 RepID=UPI001F3CF191|nr:M23 family metallopeptidase [Faecalicatena contorta]MCF2669282.1 peptidoglycan DD-metalloendopeptidase family protein [Faecalicatena contorta]
MIRRKKALSFLLVLVLCLGMAIQANATEISETQKKAEELEKKKKDAEKEKQSLEKQLESIVSEMEETKTKIEEKETEISAKEEELIQAKVDENDQYESMKKRIKYMYENGNTQFVEILCESKSIGEFLNNAEYITTISEYDRTMLVEFQAVVKDVEEQEAALQAEYDELETMQNDLITKQDSVTELMESKDAEIEQISSDLGDTKDKLSELQAAAAAAERKQQEKNSGYSNNAGASVITGNGTFTHPCPGYTYISSEFGYREQPIAGASTNHKGMDFAAPIGTPIYAAASGTVTSASYSGNAGNMIVINHGNGLQTYYMHCNSMYVRAGQTVSKGQNIGAVGSTGNSSGPHLHFQVMQNGTPVNPRNYL